MPNRILRDWTDSDRFDGLSPEAERLFVRLLMKADDYGRFHAEARRVKAACFPLIPNLRPTDVDGWLRDLAERRLVLRYKAEDRDLLAIPRFRQRLKKSVPKFPPPPGKPPDWLPDADPFPDVPGTSGKSPPESDTETKAHAETDTETKGGGGRGLDGMPPVPAVLATGPFLAAWDEFKVHRTQIREKLTPLAATKQLAKLAEMGPARATAAINHSIANGWTGIFEPDATKGPSNGKRKPTTPAERGEYGGLTELGVRRLGGGGGEQRPPAEAGVPADPRVGAAVPGGPGGALGDPGAGGGAGG